MYLTREKYNGQPWTDWVLVAPVALWIVDALNHLSSDSVVMVKTTTANHRRQWKVA